jgi:ASCH domain
MNSRTATWNDETETLMALSVRQPWAWLITQGIKDIENRSYRLVTLPKRVLIHASSNFPAIEEEDWTQWNAWAGRKIPLEHDIGGIVGVATITACMRRHGSVWKDPASWGWVLEDARPLPFRECKGAVGFFKPTYIAKNA